MSGTTATKITNLSSEGGNTLPAGATVRLRWTALPAAVADEYRAEEQVVENPDGTKVAAPVWASWGRVPAPPFSKGGLANGLRNVRVVARKGGGDVAGSASDPIALRVGPVPTPAPTPAPAPTPTPAPATTAAPTYATAADLAALAARVAAVEKAQPATGTTTPPGVLPADLPRGGGVVTGDATLVVRAGEVVVATAK